MFEETYQRAHGATEHVTKAAKMTLDSLACLYILEGNEMKNEATCGGVECGHGERAIVASRTDRMELLVD